jgi:hypothetical protein|tara:strand:- start:147 stop:308 length:162 start_codon:yes stop_codon:yes gene_type:complete
MWVLLWVQLATAGLEHYHIGSYTKQEVCELAKADAKVLVTSDKAKIVCIKIEL